MTVQLKSTEEAVHALGTVSYRVIRDGQWIGWVGDVRPWRGWRYGNREWWACWRQDGDTAARWSGDDPGYPTRGAALAALLNHITDQEDPTW